AVGGDYAVAGTLGSLECGQSHMSKASVPRLAFSHMGMFVADVARMEDFYTRVLGFTVTDRGDLETPRGKVFLVFLSRDPKEHHQIVLASGKPEGLPFNPINQISFRMASFGGLREM